MKEKTALGHWREVRAYDASDLEQWAEHSATAQIWLAELLNIPVEGYRSLERCWQGWAAVTEPRLSMKLFDPAVEAHAAPSPTWADAARPLACINAVSVAAYSRSEIPDVAARWITVCLTAVTVHRRRLGRSWFGLSVNSDQLSRAAAAAAGAPIRPSAALPAPSQTTTTPRSVPGRLR